MSRGREINFVVPRAARELHSRIEVANKRRARDQSLARHFSRPLRIRLTLFWVVCKPPLEPQEVFESIVGIGRGDLFAPMIADEGLLTILENHVACGQ